MWLCQLILRTGILWVHRYSDSEGSRRQNFTEVLSNVIKINCIHVWNSERLNNSEVKLRIFFVLNLISWWICSHSYLCLNLTHKIMITSEEFHKVIFIHLHYAFWPRSQHTLPSHLFTVVSSFQKNLIILLLFSFYIFTLSLIPLQRNFLRFLPMILI